LFDKNTNKLLYIAKVVDVTSVQYKKSTPTDVLYDNMDTFINGQGSEKNANRAAQMFLDAANQDMESLKLRSIVKDATYYKLIATKADGFIYEVSSGAMMGRTPSEVVEYLKNPLNEEILVNLTKKVEKYWNQ
jgi:V8-like Glu-specific endopeptidase